MNKTFQFEQADREYEVEYDFHPGEPATRDDPGSGPEVSPEAKVKCRVDGKRYHLGDITFEEFITLYAIDTGNPSVASAEDKLIEELTDHGMETYESAWDDAHEFADD